MLHILSYCTLTIVNISLTVPAFVARLAITPVVIDQILAGTSVLAREISTVVDILKREKKVR